MKTILVVLALAVAVQASKIGDILSLPSEIKAEWNKDKTAWKKMSPEERVKEHRKNCPDMTEISEGDLTLNLGINIEDSIAHQNPDFETGVTCMSGRSLKGLKDLLKVNPTEDAKNRPHGEAPSRRRRQAAAAPASYDARTLGLVGPVLNQGNCGSCWTFSATGAIDGAIKKKTGTLPSTSQQNLVDCIKTSSSDGCNGGWMTDAYDYDRTNGGIDNSTVYKYVAAKQTSCKYTTTGNVLPKTTSFAYTKQGDETDLKTQLFNQGVIAVAMQAGTTAFQNYVGGIYSCSNFTGVDHGVLLVGYGTNATTAQDFWIVKNSWGPTWGEQGFFRVLRNKGSSLDCGIPDYANYPII